MFGFLRVFVKLLLNLNLCQTKRLDCPLLLMMQFLMDICLFLMFLILMLSLFQVHVNFSIIYLILFVDLLDQTVNNLLVIILFVSYFDHMIIGMSRQLFDGIIDSEDVTPASTLQMALDVANFIANLQRRDGARTPTRRLGILCSSLGLRWHGQS